MVPKRTVEEQDDRLAALVQLGERAIEPAKLCVGKSGLDSSLAVLGVEDHEARELGLDGVVERTEALAVLIRERAIAAIALAAHDVVVARGRIEGHAQCLHDVEEVTALLEDVVVIAGIALHEVADAEHGVGQLAVEVGDRLAQIAEAPIAAGGAVRHDREDLPPRCRDVLHLLSVERLAGRRAIE